MPLTGLAGEGWTDRLSGSFARRPSRRPLDELLVPAPYVVPEKKAKKKATGTRKSSRRPVESDSSSDDSEAHSSHEDEEEEREVSSPPARGENKRKAAPTGEAGGSKKGRTLPPDYSTNAADTKTSGHPGPSP